MRSLLKFILQSVLVLFTAGTLCGCATIFCGTKERMKIASNPTRATVFLNGDEVGVTPLTFELDRDSAPLVVLAKEGFPDTRVAIETGMNAAVLSNVFLGPLMPIGIVVDVRSGAALTFEEDEILVPLLRKNEKRKELYDGDVVLTRFED